MAEDTVITGQKKTVNEINNTFANTSKNLSTNLTAASDVLDASGEILQHGQEENATHINSGVNTTVAKDSKGNAIGTYDWEAQAEHTAKISYNSDVLSAKQEAGTAKQELVTNQQQGQVQHDMAGYSAAQSAEKAGWTGGYVLDSNRQVAFLKESIKANLYSQEELQKYGYDTALAAARANYDLKKSELAMQNYNTAIQNAFQMAEFTGKFVSPETSFHLSQIGVADKILQDSSATEEEKAKAREIKTSVESWFQNNNISKEGVYCISVLMDNFNAANTAVANLSSALTENESAWAEYKIQLISMQEAVDAKNENSVQSGLFSYIDEYGDIKTVSANLQEAAITGKLPENIPEDAKPAYNSMLGRFISGNIESSVRAEMTNRNFESEDAAIKHANAILKGQLVNINANNTVVNTFTITCKINGVDTTLELGGDTVEKCKTLEGALDTTSTIVTHNNETFSEYNEAIGSSIGALKSGENFHIARTAKEHGESNNWDLELQEDLSKDIDTYKKSLGIPDNYKGLWYNNTKNKGPCFYISDTKLFVIGPQFNKREDYEKFEKAMAKKAGISLDNYEVKKNK